MLANNNIKDIYRLSPMQEGMYFHSIFDPTSTAYFIQICYRIYGVLDIAVVEESFNKILSRYDILRTIFNHEKKDLLLQVVLKERKIDFHYEDLRNRKLNEIEEYLEQCKGNDLEKTFNLNKDVLVRVTLLQLRAHEYELIWSFHHILMDGWCLEVLTEEFLEIYNASEKNLVYRLPHVHQYKNYIEWLDTQDNKKARRYWGDYLNGYKDVITLPKKLTTEINSYNLTKCSFELGVIKTKALYDICTRYQITLNTVFNTLWGILLGVYNNKKDVVFGAVVSGRPPQVEGILSMVGLFVNTVPIRVSFDSETTFLQLLRKNHDQLISSEEFHYCQLAEIQNESEVKNDLINHIVVFENYPVKKRLGQKVGIEDENGGFEIGKVEVFEKTGYDFNVIIEPGNSVTIEFKYNSNVFANDFVSTISLHFNNLIRQFTENVNLKIDAVSIITDAEKRSLIKFNETQLTYPSDLTIQELFQLQVQKTPDAIAVVFEGKLLTYKQLNERSNVLANFIIDTYHTEEGDLIGILLDRTEQTIVSILGILKSGAAYVPIDPHFPTDRINYIFNDAQFKLLITESKYLHLTKDYSQSILTIDTVLLNNSLLNHPVEARWNPKSLAYVIYTSGSTGRPKGVMMENGSVINFVFGKNQIIYNRYSQKLKIALIASFISDPSVQQIFCALLNGHSLYVVPEEVKRSGYEMWKYYLENGIELSDGTPSHLSILLSDLLDYDTDMPLRHFIFGGEILAKQKVEQLFKSYKAFYPTITNVYGPTECCINATYYEINVDNINDLTIIPIGRPLPNYKVHILNLNKLSVPVGIIGEIYISGPGLARGYLNNKQSTEEKFVINTVDQESAKLYRTGDYGKWLSNGQIEFLGRIDEQVKIRGYRIEIGEIESWIAKHEKVSDVIVVPKKDSKQENYLIAYYIPKESLSNGELKSYLKQYVPEYMIPAFFISLEKFPQARGGKTDRNLLPLPEEEEAASGLEYLLPTDEVEQRLLELWRMGLERERISILDNFFDIGGHSIKATQLISRIAKEFGVKIDLKAFFGNPTIYELGKILRKLSTEQYCKIIPIEEQEYYSLSNSQQRLWILEQLEEGQFLYNNVPISYEIQGLLDRDVLQKAIDIVINRHEILRTTFIAVNGDPKQFVDKRNIENYKINFRDLSLTQDKEELLKSLLKNRGEEIFDLEKGNLLKFNLFKLDETTYIFQIVIHHIISDGWSMDILFDEINRVYNGVIKNEDVKYLPLLIQYKDFSAWQNGKLNRKNLEGERQYWFNCFKDEIPKLNLTIENGSKKALKKFSGNRVFYTVDKKDVVNSLKAIANHNNASLFMLLLASVKTLLYRYTGQQDIVIGTPVATRNHIDLENQIGCYVNILPLRTKFETEDNFEILLRRVRETVLNGFQNQNYPFDYLIDDLRNVLQLEQPSLFDVMVVFQSGNNKYTKDKSNGGLKIKEYETEFDVSKYNLTFNFYEESEAIYLTLEYNTDLFSPDTIVRLCNHFGSLLESVSINKNCPIKYLDYLSSKEKDQLLKEFNNTAQEFPDYLTITQLFEEQVQKCPDRIAVVLNNASFTYTYLNELSNKFAHFLRSNHDVVVEDTIGVMIDRSEKMIWAILGILKAGAAYVPINPDFPQNRIEYIVKDSNLKVLLVDEINERHYVEVKKISLNEVLPILSQFPSINPVSIHHNRNLAYVIYTSGSTGSPKGVMIEHRSSVNMIVDQIKSFNISDKDNVLQFATLSFDASVYEIFMALLGGSSLILIEKDNIKDYNSFTNYIKEKSVSVVTLPPSYLNLLEFDKLEFLRVIITAGEAPSVENSVHFASLCDYYNAFGPTECAVCISKYKVTLKDKQKLNIPIGKPIANTQMIVLDENLQLVPIGVEGEIYVSGVGLARGYVNQKELTGEKFIPNPFNRNEKIYKSGDLGRWDADGNIEFRGRRDQQVKLRGYRIELKEIENVLLKIKPIKDAVVALNSNTNHQKLIAYYISDEDIQSDKIHQFVKEWLPDYMVPDHFVKLDSFPTTLNGKINFDELAKIQPANNGKRFMPPTHDTEVKLVKLWSEILGVERIGVTNNFFELGGNSLQLIKLHKRMISELDPNVSIADLFKYNSIKSLRDFIDKKNMTQSLQSIEV